MLFASTRMAARLEAAECDLLTASADAVARLRPDDDVQVVGLGGGVAIHAGHDSPLTKVAGLGFDGALEESALAPVEAHWRQRGAAVQVELSTLADPAIGTMLTGRGYALVGFENVLGLALGDSRRPAALLDVRVERAEAADIDAWLDVVATGFAAPDEAGVPSHEKYDRDALERVIRPMSQARGMVRYLARRNGVPAGGASMRLGSGVAHLAGAATLPAHRRQGVQRALLQHRLADAAAAGCDIAVVTTLPGSTSQKNVQSLGFQLLYSRAILVLPVDASAVPAASP